MRQGGEKRSALGDGNVAGLGRDPRQPGANGGVGFEVVAALIGHVGLGVERDVGDGVALAHEIGTGPQRVPTGPSK